MLVPQLSAHLRLPKRMPRELELVPSGWSGQDLVVQEEEVPPGVLRQVLVGLHPLTQKGEIRMKLFCASLTAGYKLLSILSTMRNRT